VTKVLKGWEDATLAEAVGISEAMKWIVSQQLNDVIVETDAEIIVKAIQKKIFPRTMWGNVARSCARVLEDLSQVTIQWVNRKGNKVAHALARHAMVKPNKFWPNNFPNCILPHIPDVT
jgi:ribonuclease HI